MHNTLFTKTLTILLTFSYISFPILSLASKEINVPEDFKSIILAVNHASNDDVIVVAPGHYSENIIIEKPLTLRSRNGALTTIISSDDPKKPVLNINKTKGVRIIGFTIEGSERSGIYIYKSAENKILNNVVKNNYNGIHLNYGRDNIIKDNSSDENVTGIYLYFSDNNEISSNNANSNVDKGIVLHESHQNRILKNQVVDNTWNGITLTSSTKNVIKKNTVVKNTFPLVITNKSVDNIVEDNKTMRRIHLIVPVILIYLAIFMYLVERKIFITYYRIKE